MAKKSKRNLSETVVKSILDDLQNENSSPSTPLELVDVESDGQSLDLSDKAAGEEKSVSTDLSSSLEADDKTGRTALVLDSANPQRSDDSKSDVVIHSFEETSRTQPAGLVNMHTQQEDPATKISYGMARPLTKSSSHLATSVAEAHILQTENLRLAQSRLLDLEKEVEELRQENELLASAAEIAQNKSEELFAKMHDLERTKSDDIQHYQMEMNIYRENLIEKDKELAKAKQKSIDLENRLAKDFKKIRVRERELENRLELIKVEKQALLRAKDDTILDLKNKIESLTSEVEHFKNKCLELGDKVSDQSDQLTRTVRALRLALTHLESNDSTSNLAPLKKAE